MSEPQCPRCVTTSDGTRYGCELHRPPPVWEEQTVEEFFAALKRRQDALVFVAPDVEDFEPRLVTP